METGKVLAHRERNSQLWRADPHVHKRAWPGEVLEAGAERPLPGDLAKRGVRQG